MNTNNGVFYCKSPLILRSKSGWVMSRRISQLKLILNNPNFLTSWYQFRCHPRKNFVLEKSNHERSQYDLDQVMVMRLNAVATAANDLNIYLSDLDIAEELEQKSSHGTLLLFLASNTPLSRRFFWYLYPPPPGYKGVPLECNRQMTRPS